MVMLSRGAARTGGGAVRCTSQGMTALAPWAGFGYHEAMHPLATAPRPWLITLSALSSLWGLFGATAAARAAEPWPVVGRQGLVQVVIVPTADAARRAAYVEQVGLLCRPETTCFINFYTNSTGAPVSLPLSEAVEREATAVFRRSAKNGVERLQWACRMKQDNEACF